MQMAEPCRFQLHPSSAGNPPALTKNLAGGELEVSLEVCDAASRIPGAWMDPSVSSAQLMQNMAWGS